jgi:hypothetical protein
MAMTNTSADCRKAEQEAHQHQGQEYVEAYLHSTHVFNVWGLMKHRENLTFALIRRHNCNLHNN